MIQEWLLLLGHHPWGLHGTADSCLYNLHIQFIYRVITRCWFIYFRQLLNSLLAWILRLGRSNALASLYHVAFDCLVWRWKIPTRITFEEWYATMTYWLPLLALIGNRPVSSIYNMCFCKTCTYNSLTESFPGFVSSISGISWNPWLLGFLGLVDRTHWQVCTMWPLIVSSADGKYLVVLI